MRSSSFVVLLVVGLCSAGFPRDGIRSRDLPKTYWVTSLADKKLAVVTPEARRHEGRVIGGEGSHQRYGPHAGGFAWPLGSCPPTRPRGREVEAPINPARGSGIQSPVYARAPGAPAAGNRCRERCARRPSTSGEAPRDRTGCEGPIHGPPRCS